jgi:hypothetical protein
MHAEAPAGSYTQDNSAHHCSMIPCVAAAVSGGRGPGREPWGPCRLTGAGTVSGHATKRGREVEREEKERTEAAITGRERHLDTAHH